MNECCCLSKAVEYAGRVFVVFLNKTLIVWFFSVHNIYRIIILLALPNYQFVILLAALNCIASVHKIQGKYFLFAFESILNVS